MRFLDKFGNPAWVRENDKLSKHYFDSGYGPVELDLRLKYYPQYNKIEFNKGHIVSTKELRLIYNQVRHFCSVDS